MGRRPFTLYWSSVETYENCPQEFLWKRGWGAIDVGGGPGRPKPRPVKTSEHHAVFGLVIGEVLQSFYNDELWRSPGLARRLEEILDKSLQRHLREKTIDFRQAGSVDQMRQTIHDGVFNFIGKTLKQHRLLGPYSRAEVELLGYANKWTPIGGRADIVIRREDTGITILDGKNSKRYKSPDGDRLISYTNPDQLRWYALCFHLSYQKMPDRLGFVYFRYPYGDPVLDVNGNVVPGQVEPGVEWVPFTKEDLQGLAARGVEIRKQMDKEMFDPTPSPKQCRFCDYETVCPARQAQKEANRKNPKKALDVLDGATGFVEFGIDPPKQSVDKTKK